MDRIGLAEQIVGRILFRRRGSRMQFIKKNAREKRVHRTGLPLVLGKTSVPPIYCSVSDEEHYN